ncbi:MAG: 2Fe-2S iron-sulfur cluster binding domain-containing protein [Gammaproteobacteria bacterium]|nr:2Fe-2S iron-sulfur cluster binding domain-containing protein [Gammaproteobacteria bacterium]
MSHIQFENQSFSLAKEDVLTVLLNAGLEIPHNCRSGNCQSCLMKATEGTPPDTAQQGLKETLKAQSYFLACQCYPKEPLIIERPAANESRYESVLISKQWLSHNVIQLKLQRPSGFHFYAGQFVTLWKDEQLGRSYSIANLADSDLLEFHIRIIPDGRFSNWIAHEASERQSVQLQGPAGDCFYIDDNLDRDLLLVGTGTGLAPLQGILHSALKAGHRGQIDLFHGAIEPTGLYNSKQLSEIEAQHEQVSYHPCVLKQDAQTTAYLEGNISELVLQNTSNLASKKAYLCGDPELVKQLKIKLFLAGMNSKEIYLDAFEAST